MYLNCLVGDRPRNWLQWLLWAEFCYNTSFQASLKTSFRVIYGCDPPTLYTYTPGEARMPAVHSQMIGRGKFLVEIRDHLLQAQQQYKMFYDRHHCEVEFEVRQWVWFRLLHRPITSLDVQGREKLGPKFYELFQIVERMGDIAYKLLLPNEVRLHDVNVWVTSHTSPCCPKRCDYMTCFMLAC
jgi:hypothetical protein